MAIGLLYEVDGRNLCGVLRLFLGPIQLEGRLTCRNGKEWSLAGPKRDPNFDYRIFSRKIQGSPYRFPQSFISRMELNLTEYRKSNRRRF